MMSSLTKWSMIAAVLVVHVAAAADSGSHVVTQKDKKFSATSLTVTPGAKIVFKNDDEIIHNVFSASKGFEFNLSAQKPGTSTEQAFSVEGVAEVRCAFHPSMKLTVTVRK